MNRETRINNKLPVAREGFPFIFMGIGITVIFIALGWTTLTIMAGVITLFVIFFSETPNAIIRKKKMPF